MLRRAGARPGDLVMVSGTIGDGFLGLAAAQGELADPDGFLLARYRLPTPRLALRQALADAATAAADVSDGLVADARHIAEASGVRLRLDLDRLPLSPPAARWLAAQPERAQALTRLASGGDDYEVICTAHRPIPGFTVLGEAIGGEPGVEVRIDGAAVPVGAGGWRHG